MPARITRRRIIAAASFIVLAAAAGFNVARPTALHASATPTTSGIEPSSHWLDGLKAKHKQFFDNPSPNGGIALVHVMNYFDTYNKSFGVRDADINAVLTFYGGTTLFALDDTAWSKYKLGEFLEVTDAITGKPATTNPWRTAPVVLGLTIPEASIESLQKRGATLIVCNNALGLFAGLIAQKKGLDTPTVFADLKAHILPDVQLVPGMVIAVEQAQRAGLTYHRQ